MSVQAMVWVLEHSRAEHSERLVLLSLANHASGDGGEAWPSIGTIAREARLGESTVRGALERLKALGEIAEASETSPRRTRVFRVVMADPAESAPPQNLHPRRIEQDRAQNLARTPAESAPEPSVEPPRKPSDPPTPTSGGSSNRIKFRKGDRRVEWGRDRHRRANPRARGTNPRAVAAQGVAAAAASAIQRASDDAGAQWERVRAELRRAVTDSIWQLWLEPLTLLGMTSDGVLVIGAPAESRSWLEASFTRTLSAGFNAVGATGRLATSAESTGVGAARGEAA